MSIRLTGVKERPIGVLQGRLDLFFASSRSFESLQSELSNLVGQDCELADIPAREDRIQAILLKILVAAGGMQADARKVEEKTDHEHIKKYFKLRDGPWYDPHPYRYMDWQHKEPLRQVHQITCQILGTDYGTWIAQFKRESEQRKEGALVALEFQNIDQTFPSCRHTLISENPHEYVRLSVLYREKLYQQGNPGAVVSFGKEWIQSLPQEASWDDVEAMSFCVLGAAQQIGAVDLTDYLGALQRWLEAHPPSENASAFPVTPDLATSYWGRSTLVLGLFHLEQGSLALSPDAFCLYQNCSLLYPDQPLWKGALALCHISRRQWVEAKKELAGLPSDAPLVVRAQTLLNESLKERMISAGCDFSVLALSRLIPARYCKTVVFDVTLSAVQLLANTSFRNEWLPYLWNRLQQQTTIRPPLLSSALIVQDVVDCVFRNFRPLKPFQRKVSLESHALRLGHAAFVTYTHPELLTFPTAINLGSLLLSASQVYDEDTYGSPAFRALRSTAKKIISDTSAMATVAAYPDLLPLVGIQLPKTERPSSKEWFLLGIGSSTIYRLYYYPYLWAAHVMQDAHKLCSQKKYEEAIVTLTAAESSLFAGWFKSATQSYANYVRGLQQYGEGNITYAAFLMHLNRTLETLNQSSYYEVVCTQLLSTKLVVAIQQRDQTSLEEVFEEIPPKEFQKDLYVLIRAHQMSVYLDSKMWVEARTLLTQETTEIHFDIAAHLFHRMYVSAQQGNEVASEVKEIIHHLDPWPQLELFKAFLAYIHPSTQLEGVATLIELLSKTAQLSGILANLQHHQKVLLFKLYLSQEEFDSAKALLIPSNASYPELCNILLLSLLDTGEQLYQAHSLTAVQKHLQQWHHCLATPHSDMIQNYTYFLIRLEKAKKQGRLEVYEEALHSLSALCHQLRSTYGFVPNSLNVAMANIYLKISVLAKYMGNRELSLSAYASVQQLGFHVDDELYQELMGTL